VIMQRDYPPANARPLLATAPPIWSIGLLASIEAAADLADVLVVTVEALVAAGRVRVERVGGELRVRVDDIFAPPDPPAPAPLTRRLADRRRRRAAAGERPLFHDGEAEGGNAL